MVYRKKGGNGTAFGQVKRFRGRQGGSGAGASGGSGHQYTDKQKEEWRQKAVLVEEQLDADYGYVLHEGTEARLGWLLNIRPTTGVHPDSGVEVSAVCCYFLQQDGGAFKAVIPFRPYFLLAVSLRHAREVEDELRRRFPQIAELGLIEKEDLDLFNHLSGMRQTFLRLEFHTVVQLISVRGSLRPLVAANAERCKLRQAYAYGAVADDAAGAADFGGDGGANPLDFAAASGFDDAFGCSYGAAGSSSGTSSSSSLSAAASAAPVGGSTGNPLDHVMDMREHDVPYYVRAAIDAGIRVGYWYAVGRLGGPGSEVSMAWREDLVERPRPRVFAFDIETSKSALKFPDPAHDQVMMISYMLDGQGYLIINRELVGADVEDFEYTPKAEYPGPFRVTNSANEEQLLRRFCDHIRELRPHIFVTFNGDFFDWPFVEARCHQHRISMWKQIGVKRNNSDENYEGLNASHMDAFRWVMRDSYLPQGSQGLKAVTKAKLGYDPLEIDPEDMVQSAMEKPQVMASYSVSDAVATYYLYMKYVHPFIFSLCNIIPMHPDHVLRKGSGTLCENLLMVEAYAANIVFPNKKRADSERFYRGHLLESETYIGGHVEALEAGVFRSDLPYQFKLDGSAFTELREGLKDTLRFALEVEGKKSMADALNYDEVFQEIDRRLAALAEQPDRVVLPHIYHLDVGAMYPNIILTNRLQPSAVVDDATCAACDYNRPGMQCQRNMKWTWRGDVIPAHRSEYNMICARLETEKFPAREVTEYSMFGGAGAPTPTASSGGAGEPDNETVNFYQLPKQLQASKAKARLKEYCRKVYKKTHEEVIEERTACVCMRENPFYVDTVRWGAEVVCARVLLSLLGLSIPSWVLFTLPLLFDSV
jgi:DNA polymerase epsilon subunit 1